MAINNPLPILSLMFCGIGIEVAYVSGPNATKEISVEVCAVAWAWSKTFLLDGD